MYKNNASFILGGMLVVVAGLLLLVRPSHNATAVAFDSSHQSGTASNLESQQPQDTSAVGTTMRKDVWMEDQSSERTTADLFAKADLMLGTVYEPAEWDALFRTWVQDDLQGALSWIEQNTHDSDRDFYQESAGRALVALDFYAAGDALLYEPAFSENVKLISEYAAQLAADDSEAVSIWLSQIADAEAKAAAEFAVFEYRLANDPNQAFQQALEQRWLHTPAEFDAFLGQAAFAEAQTAIAPDNAWISQYPSDVQPIVAYNWAASWSSGKEDLTTWLQNISSVAVKDSALHGALDFGQEHYTPEDQVALLSALSSQADRKNTFNELLEKWATTDKQAVSAYLSASQQLPTEETEWLLQRLEAVL